MRLTTLLLLVFITFQTQQTYGQGKLGKAEKSLSKKESQNRGGGSTRHSSGSSTDSGSNFLAEEFGGLFVQLLLGATYYTVIESPVERDYMASRASITKYPYLNAKKGNYSYDWGDDTAVFRTEISNRFIAENSKLYGNHLNLDTRFLSRIGLELDYLQLWEESVNFEDNSLAIFTAMAKYYRVRTQRFDAWWGLGATYVAGEIDETGFAYGVGGEVFFNSPISLEASFYGSFINQESVNKFTASLNYHVNRFKFSGGYEYLKIGAPDFSMFSVGVGISF